MTCRLHDLCNKPRSSSTQPKHPVARLQHLPSGSDPRAAQIGPHPASERSGQAVSCDRYRLPDDSYRTHWTLLTAVYMFEREKLMFSHSASGHVKTFSKIFVYHIKHVVLTSVSRLKKKKNILRMNPTGKIQRKGAFRCLIK